ncbi:MAG: glycosyltransferase [Candidatus Omnitrophica bacterium]|nr:glycosyltransferase [Candidatus Omnitrophota bacterium]
MTGPLSVLMAVHGGERPEYLSAALESIFIQTLTPREVVLVEDGPLGKTLRAVIKAWSARQPALLRSVRLESNMGLAEALNAGLKACTCELVARMDSDDVSLGDRFERQARFFAENEDIDVLGGYSDERDASLGHTIAIRKVPSRHEDIAALIKWKNPMNHVTVMFRKEAVESAGGYPPELRKMQDYGLWAKMIKAGCRFANLPEVLVTFRAGEDFIRRRGGIGYFRYDIAVMRYLKKTGVVGNLHFAANLVLRFLSRISPPRLRNLIYSEIRRREK